MIRLETPRTLRTPDLNEVPNTKDLVDAITRSHKAKIIEGYVLKHNYKNELPFLFYAEININNSRLWNLFKELASHLPEEISLIYNHSDNEPSYGAYQNKYAVIDTLSKFKIELSQDCFLEFGVIHQTDNFFEEVFVDCTKYIRYWGMDEKWFRTTMEKFQLSEVKDLNFMDEFPKVREALRLHFDNVLETEELIEKFRIDFNEYGKTTGNSTLPKAGRKWWQKLFGSE